MVRFSNHIVHSTEALHRLLVCYRIFSLGVNLISNIVPCL